MDSEQGSPLFFRSIQKQKVLQEMQPLMVITREGYPDVPKQRMVNFLLTVEKDNPFL